MAQPCDQHGSQFHDSPWEEPQGLGADERFVTKTAPAGFAVSPCSSAFIFPWARTPFCRQSKTRGVGVGVYAGGSLGGLVSVLCSLGVPTAPDTLL